jgi:LPXTG-motif cell wall-anchored protein
MEQVSNAITGRFTDQTMWYLILGIAAAVGGVLLFAFGRRG